MPLALALVLMAGCGSAGGGDVVADAPSRESTELTIVVRPGEGSGKRAFSLTCDPTGGDHPDPEAACSALDELEDPFAPVPPRTACTEIYGGPQTARVTGTFRGEPVDARFSRTDGCQIARWDEHAALLVEAGGVGS